MTGGAGVLLDKTEGGGEADWDDALASDWDDQGAGGGTVN